MSFPEQDRAVQILEKEFGPRWKQIVQELGTKELRQRVGKELTSFMAFPERGSGGNNKWRGNCSPEVVRAILRYVLECKHYYGKQTQDFTLLDPMSGSGTSQAAAQSLGVRSLLYDLNPAPACGIGGWDALRDEVDDSADLIFLHPPYHNLIPYSGNMWGTPHKDDLSRCSSYPEFVEKLNYIVQKLFMALRRDGRLAILVGDIRTKGSFYSMQHDLMRVGQMEAFIVKGQYNCVSDTRSYKKPFIPVVTEYLLLFHKQDALFFPFAVRRETTVDLRKEDIPGLTWHHLIRLTMEELSGRAKLSDLGDRLAAHPKAKKNPHFRDRIRATAYEHPGQYISCGNGFYALNYAVAYRDLRRGDNELDALEKAYGEKLSTFPALSRDIYQSFYSLNVRRQPEDAISEQARRFNAPILNEVMDGEDYPAIKAACEGRQLPAYEAASEFISQVAGNLDELLEKASGKKGALNTLERLEQKRDRSMEELQKLMKQIAQAGPEQLPELEKQAVKAANQAQSQVNQTEAVGHMVRDQMLQNKEAVSGCFAQAVRAAAQKAESVSSALLAWGYGPDSNDPERRAADLELAARVGKSPTLMEVARYLGRLKELMDGKRKNGYAYGRGEKYSLELGGDINRAIASEFAMLAAPETLPLFLRKLQRKALKQYQRREPICKGSGDIICMLDESSSAESQAPWCKAVALALLDIAMRDQRRFAVIHFAGVGDVQTDLFLPGQYDREDVLRCAETFLNGNTDYETPLREALRLMEQEGFENADMVFVTDGECVLPDSFLEKLKAEQSARGFQITGILLDQEDAGFEFSLRESCTNVYRTSQLSRDQIAEQLVVSRVA